jgi:predicted DNA-binding transcriptional regulator AlpA
MPTVLTMTGLKHSQLYCLIAEGQFPAPVNIGARAVAWRIEDVQAWTGSRSRARHAGRVQLTDSQATVVARKRVTVPANPSMYPPLDAEVRDTVSTDAAAFYLGRRPQTLRSWATYENGPLRPMRVNGRLAWPVAEIKRVLAGRPRRSSPDAAQ